MARVFAQPDNRYSSKMRLACALLMVAIDVVAAQIADRAVGSVPSTGLVEYPCVTAAEALTNVWPRINQALGINMTDVRPRKLFGRDHSGGVKARQGRRCRQPGHRRPPLGVRDVLLADVHLDDRRAGGRGSNGWRGPPPGVAQLEPERGHRQSQRAGASAPHRDQRDLAGGVGVPFEDGRSTEPRRSCLLRTGAFVDDNARALGLPPLRDCDSTYVPSSP